MQDREGRIGKLTCLVAACLLALPATAGVPAFQTAGRPADDVTHGSDPVGSKEPVKDPDPPVYDDPAYEESDDDVSPGPPPTDDDDDDKDRDWVVPAIAIGAIAVAVIHSAMKKKPPSDPGPDPVDPASQELADQLLRNGPEFSGLYNTSAFLMSGLAKGGWPIVVEFELPQPGYVELMIRTRTSDTFRYRLDGGAVGRRHIVLPLPPGLGDNLEPALIAVTATMAPGSGETLPGFQLIGLGCGPRAIGSVAIDKVTLSTPEIRSSAGQTTAYSFFAHSSFENAVVDFMKVKDSADGETYDWVNNHQIAGGVEANRWVGEQERLYWDGRSRERETSLGVHKVQVRVWHSEGDWVSAWSDSSVFVRD